MQRTNEIFHSEPVEDILGAIPIWITKYGIALLIGIFGIIGIGCYLIKYPQTIVSQIILTSENPPSDFLARYDGLVDSVFVTNGQQVSKGQLIALLSTSARYNDIVAIENIVLEVNKSILCPLGGYSIAKNSLPIKKKILLSSDFYKEYCLGDLQVVWEELVRACADYNNWLDISQAENQKILVKEQIHKTENYYADLLLQSQILKEDVKYECKTVERDSILLSKGVISYVEYENSMKNLISKRGALAAFNATLTNTQLSILKLRQQLIELDIQRQTEEAELIRNINQQLRQIKTQISQWKELYAIISPSDGIVSLQTIWGPNQHIALGEIIASVVPHNKNNTIGRLTVSSSMFGNIKLGQKVNVKLNGFPYMEFGILKGEVNQIAAVPQQITSPDGVSIAYTVYITFPQGLISSYGQVFPMLQQMDGTAEIITQNKRLIERLVDPVISLFKNS